MSETTVQEAVSVPAGSDALAVGVKKLLLAVVAAHKAGGGALVEIPADVAAAVSTLGPALSQVGLVGGEVAVDPIGVAEALALAGLETAKVLVGSPSAAQS